MARAHVDVHVARGDGEDGTIRIAAGPALGRAEDDGGPDFARAVLDVSGAVLSWPVREGPGLPVAEVHDVGRAQQWLWALYGERTAGAVQACVTGEPAGVRVTADVTALAGAAARLGFGHWAARWWPASYVDGIPALEPDLLGLELAALTHWCQQLFGEFDDVDDFNGFLDFGDFGDGHDGRDGRHRSGDQPDGCAAQLIEDHQAALDPLIRWWRAAPRSADTARHLESVLRLLDDAADAAGLDGQPLRRLRSALEQHRPAGPTVDVGTLFVRRDGYALAAGDPLVAGGRVIARGSGTNDWRRYPPGFVDASETAVSWTARALGARRQIEVEIVAHVAAPVAGAPLVAEVGVNGGRRTRVPLGRRDDVWTGRADLDPHGPAGAVPSRFEVDVLLPGFDPGPGGPEDRAARDAIRTLVRRRLATAAQPLAYDGSPHDASSGPFLAEIAAVATATEEDY
ncbi:hypothetical protein OG613_25445 [Streptomyces sp. NBC_00015]|uniref:hypothetical protein n=1 Tax=unclassified Streptomyces TaxID=2593676 RepID=UPI00224D2E0E|nr:hypothetical protein [Streptomyces sp. NBC_00103]MCX5368940.1 hypothetical protein [Streptomyces sp. NBC_00103]